jgi:hypothetical protein
LRFFWKNIGSSLCMYKMSPGSHKYSSLRMRYLLLINFPYFCFSSSRIHRIRSNQRRWISESLIIDELAESMHQSKLSVLFQKNSFASIWSSCIFIPNKNVFEGERSLIYCSSTCSYT